MVEKNIYSSTDDILIAELIDLIKISVHAKAELQKEVTDNGSMGWQSLTTIAMSSKQIQSLITKLNLTPELKAKKVKDVENKEQFNLQEILGAC